MNDGPVKSTTVVVPVIKMDQRTDRVSVSVSCRSAIRIQCSMVERSK